MQTFWRLPYCSPASLGHMGNSLVINLTWGNGVPITLQLLPSAICLLINVTNDFLVLRKKLSPFIAMFFRLIAGTLRLFLLLIVVISSEVVQWRIGKVLDLRSIGLIPGGTKLHNNLGQVVHTYVPLSPSSITWYWSKDVNWCSSARKVTAGLAESNDSLSPEGWLKKSPAGWLPVHRVQLRAQRSVTSMGELYILPYILLQKVVANLLELVANLSRILTNCFCRKRPRDTFTASLSNRIGAYSLYEYVRSTQTRVYVMQ